ncbi:MAG: DUF2807 domain-containing protein [Bacteroidales bacterium]|nr:DUF2807 domain-containing protein [Bacteroidales bacterium]
MKKYLVFGGCLGLLVLASCRDKDLDMTLRQTVLYEGLEYDEITAEDAWCVTVLQDAEKSYVELEYSAFLEDYLDVNLTGTKLSIGLDKKYNLPNNTVINATVHTPMVRTLNFSDAAFAALDNLNMETALTLELDGAASCRGGHFQGAADIKLSDASTCVEFYFDGTDCQLELADASIFKGCLNVSGDLHLDIHDASYMTEYSGEINHAVAKVSENSHLNMATSWINRMHIDINALSEATVNVVESLEGSVSEVSRLYYSGNPTLNVDCDETSILQAVEYPNPE